MMPFVSTSSVERLADGGFFEGLRWHEGRWWASDFYRKGVFAYSTDGAEELVVTVDQQPSGLGWLPDGSLLVVSMKDRRLLCRRTDGKVEEFADLSAVAGGRLNDMVVDQLGRAWVGNFGYDVFGGGPEVPADLIRVSPDRTVDIGARSLRFPNGSIVTDDGRTLVVGESFAHCLTAFTITDDGRLVDRRLWADLPDAGVDGCCLDAEGHIWVADPLGRRCLRVAEGGAVVDEIRPNGDWDIYACMLGGEDGRTLLMCGAPGYSEDPEERKQAGPGVLLTTIVDVPHAGLP
jgi:sugar lactone lactonase YvrE